MYALEEEQTIRKLVCPHHVTGSRTSNIVNLKKKKTECAFSDVVSRQENSIRVLSRLLTRHTRPNYLDNPEEEVSFYDCKWSYEEKKKRRLILSNT